MVDILLCSMELAITASLPCLVTLQVAFSATLVGEIKLPGVTISTGPRWIGILIVYSTSGLTSSGVSGRGRWTSIFSLS